MSSEERIKAERFTREYVEWRMRQSLNRRQFVQRMGGLVLASGFGTSVLAACGGSSSDGGSDVADAGAEGAGNEVGTESIGGTLNMIVWEGYDDPNAAKPFVDQYGVTVAPTYMGDNEEIFTKLKGGGLGGVDLVTPYHGYVKPLVEADLIDALDYSRLPNAASYFDRFQQPEWNTFDGKTYSAPYVWGTSPLPYNADFIKEPPESWLDVMKPEYKGKVVMLDETLGTSMVWGRVLNYWAKTDPSALPIELKADGWPDATEPTQLTEAQFEDVVDMLIAVKTQQVRAVAASFGDMADMLARGDAWLATVGWEAVSAFAAAKGGNVPFTHPVEGDFAFCDNWCIAKDAPNSDTAYAWIDWMIGPEAQAVVVKAVSSGTVNENAVEVLDPDTRAIYPYEDLTPVFDKAPFFSIPPSEAEGDIATLAYRNKAWERLRAA